MPYYEALGKFFMKMKEKKIIIDAGIGYV